MFTKNEGGRQVQGLTKRLLEEGGAQASRGQKPNAMGKTVEGGSMNTTSYFDVLIFASKRVRKSKRAKGYLKNTINPDHKTYINTIKCLNAQNRVDFFHLVVHTRQSEHRQRVRARRRLGAP